MWSALAVLAAAAPALAAAPPPPCPGVRFLVEPPLVPDSSVAVDAITVDEAGDVAIASGCPPVRARLSKRGRYTSVRGRWTTCGPLRSVRLNVKIDESCASLTGTMTARASRRRSFTAPASVCGDGWIDPDAGEQCEIDADCTDTACTACVCGGAITTTTSTSTTRPSTTLTTTTSTTRPPTTLTTTSTTRPSTTLTVTTTTRPPTTVTVTSTTRPPTTVTVTTTRPPTTLTTVTTTLAVTPTTRASTTTTTGATPTTIPGRLFEAPNPWNTDVSTLPKSAQSDGIIQALSAAGGWGTGTMRIDFSIEVLESNASTPFRSFTPTGDFYSPDCDHVPFPVPPGGAIEGEDGYECTSDGDCHLIVVHRPTKTLYEMWRADIVGPTFRGGCAAVWDLTRAYPADLRGDQCSSADAGGFPIAAMLFSADEVARGSIDHAIRFILPNSRMRSGVYVRPASHAGGPSGGSTLPPYGVRFRLRADFPLASLPTEGARVIARALQRYGMILSDGGNIALTAQSDRFTTHKWSEVGVDTRALQAIRVTDMEVVGLGSTIPLTYDCERNP